jgi:ribosomal protein S21
MSRMSVKTLEMRRVVPGLVPSRRPAHVVVAVTAVGGVEAATKQLKKLMMFSGTWKEMSRRDSGYTGPGEQRRKKSRAARSKERKRLKRQEMAAARAEAAGV